MTKTMAPSRHRRCHAGQAVFATTRTSERARLPLYKFLLILGSMATDPIETAHPVEREVRNGNRDGVATKIVVVRRTYPTDRADLWNALTEPERLPRWFAPVDGDLELGGRFQVQGNAGGVVEHCDEPETFTVTWEMGEVASWVTVTLTATDDGTLLELVHEAPVDPDFWAEYGPGAVGVGWDLALVGLGMHVDRGEPVDPDLQATFTLTPEGRTIVEHAAGDWASAAARAGDDESDARAAAEQTVAFYTTDPTATGE